MNERMLELRQRRGELQVRIEVQRGQLAEIASSWERPLALADRGISVLRYLRGHPLLVGGAVALVVLQRRGVAGLLKRAWQMWKSYRYFAGL
jgi:hypothetical protein